MPSDRGRAPRACVSCRRQKTRCYESTISGAACLRCDRLNQRCSFVRTPTIQESVAGRNTDARYYSREAFSAQANDHRIDRLERTVAALLDRLGEDPTSIIADRSHKTNDRKPALPPGVASDPKDNASSAPVMVIRELATDMGMTSPGTRSPDSVLGTLVTPDLASDLLTIFLKHYGQWVLFDPESDPNTLLATISRSPLLQCACFLIAVRHTSVELATRLAPKLYECAKSQVSAALLIAPQSIEFFQAVLVLCLWSTTVGQVPLSIDGWLLSGYALQHCQCSPLFDIPTDQAQLGQLDKNALDRWCLWNHLCLVHLHYCIGTSRKAMLHASQIEKCRPFVDYNRLTNFELRMVAEVHLYWTVYQASSANPVDLLKALADLQKWKTEWQFVLDQPRAQFIMMGFHFAHLLLYDKSLKFRSIQPGQSIISEMINHATTLTQLAMDTTDEETRHLSDHIYHMITFAAIVICRLLNMHKDQLATSFNIDELDALVLRLITWLRDIGLPCHAAHTLGDLIARAHQKLCPRVQSPSTLMDPSQDLFGADFTNYFPEFLGVEATGDASWALLPGWSAFQGTY